MENYENSYKLCLYSLSLMNDQLVPWSKYRRHATGSLQLFSNDISRDASFTSMQEGIGELGCEIIKLNREECISKEPSLDGGLNFTGGIYTPIDSSGDIYQFSKEIQVCKALFLKDKNVFI